jgi:CRP-like cAMP-binding protein
LKVSDQAFLAALTPDEEDALRLRAVTRSFPRGAALFHELQAADKVVVLLSGRVKLSATTDDGREVIFGIRGAGELLGELSTIDGEPRSASATALEPVEALVLPPPAFTSFLESHPRAAQLVTRLIGQRLRDADEKRLGFAAQDSIGRVAARIVEMCDRFGEPEGAGMRIGVPITQEELAGWTGCSREAVSRALHTLRELGWIRTERRNIVVLELDSLRERAV